ncbi:class I SAM-dependent methyltransferase [Rhizomonospora bruguierae]|uniref:class I SAM-dependent methyltransferase n=1 Tax=Rhizomonospora bruguierae TaxID=1581705 RepID=UPI001BCDEA02|nr:class I SAM-dependent methyltransferase [Micromonospora sp. NBRC 107566]
MTTRYALDNDDPRAVTHHILLSRLLDPYSCRRAMSLLDLRGKRCLEVGAGAGRFAFWLAHQVGPHGEVLATDVKPLSVPYHPQLTVRQHDLTASAFLDGTDPSPLEPAGWDFVHARLTLGHLPQRRTILTRLADCLRPGGWLLVEDWDASRTDMVLAAPDPASARLYGRFQEILGARVFAASGTDRGWARRIHAAMLAERLVDVETTIQAQSWAGGSPGSQLVGGTIRQLWDRLLAAGLTASELEQVQLLVQNPRLVLAGHPLFSTSGRRSP